MVQSGITILPILGGVFKTGTEALKPGAPILAKNETKFLVDKGINMPYKKFTSSEGWWIKLTNNEIKDNMKKLIKFLENRVILLKETTEKVINKKGGFLNSLMKIGLPLMKNVLKPLAKIIVLP